MNMEAAILPTLTAAVLRGLEVNPSHIYRPELSSPRPHLPRVRSYRTLVIIDGADPMVQGNPAQHAAFLKSGRFLQDDCNAILLEPLPAQSSSATGRTRVWLEISSALKYPPYSLDRACTQDLEHCAAVLERVWVRLQRQSRRDAAAQSLEAHICRILYRAPKVNPSNPPSYVSLCPNAVSI